MSGLTVAATLRRAGFNVQVYEQAARFERVGAGIQMMPNSMQVLRRIGIEEKLRAVAFEPYSHLNRERGWLTAASYEICPCLRACSARLTCACIGQFYTARSPRSSRKRQFISIRNWPGSINVPARSRSPLPTVLAPRPMP